VTGAAGGIGVATVRRLVEEGASVAATDLQAPPEAPGVLALAHDVASEADWERVVAAVVERFGKLSVLVNNAGVFRVAAVPELLDPDTTLVTGAAPKNVGALLRARQERAPGSLGRLFVQGGFAGDDVVPPEDRLPKFAGRTTCPSFNLNGDPKSALLVVERAAWFADLRFVSKNVCHGVVWDREVADAVAAGIEAAEGRWRRALELIALGLRGMDGKALHDPFAACCAIDPPIARWARVVPYRARGEWGARPDPSSPIRIVTGYDRAKFLRVLVGEGGCASRPGT
jgi:pyrimidine-specific ribonucleoside hydrolase